MRVVLADLKSDRGFVNKDTVVGGYGSRLDPFSRVTRIYAWQKRYFHDVPSVHMAYIAAILARAGHEVNWTRGDRDDPIDADVAIVLSSLVDHKSETAWADQMRGRGMKVGFIGITASKMPFCSAGKMPSKLALIKRAFTPTSRATALPRSMSKPVYCPPSAVSNGG